MHLYEEIFQNTEGISLSRCTIVPGGGGFFEGVKAVGDFSPLCVEICFPKMKVAVEGQDLAIVKYVDGDLQLSGRIDRLSVEREGV